MKFAIVSESYKASTINHTALTQQVSQVTVMEDSLAAFQVILADDQTTRVNIWTTYRFGENLQTPVYRVAVTGDSGLQPVVHLVDYYTDNHGIAYADKIIADELPPRLLISAEYDGIIGQAHQLWRKIGVSQKHQYLVFAGMRHTFLDAFGYLPQAQLAVDQIVNWLHADK